MSKKAIIDLRYLYEERDASLLADIQCLISNGYSISFWYNYYWWEEELTTDQKKDVLNFLEESLITYDDILVNTQPDVRFNLPGVSNYDIFISEDNYTTSLLQPSGSFDKSFSCTSFG